MWMGVPVALKTCHHFQDPSGQTGTDRLHCASSQKQQHTVSDYAGLALAPGTICSDYNDFVEYPALGLSCAAIYFPEAR